MANPFYTRMQSLALNLLTKYGDNAQLLAYDDANNEVLVSNCKAVSGTITSDNRPNTLVETPDGLIYINNVAVAPDTSHYLRWNGTVYKIVYVQTFQPATQTILYGLFIKV